MRLWERIRIRKSLGEDSRQEDSDSRDFGRGFTRIRGLWERIHKDS